MTDFEPFCFVKLWQLSVHTSSFVPELTPADSVQVMLPDLDAVYICPCDNTKAIIFADLFWEGAPYNICPRQALKKIIQEKQDAGYTGFAGIEPEYIVMKYNEKGEHVKAIDNDPPHWIRPRRQAFGYDVEYSLDSMYFLKVMIYKQRNK